MKGEGKVVCVTGASGFIASCLIQSLLHRGYTVQATIRNLGDPTKAEHLKALDGANQRLRLFEADLMKEGSFDAAVDGCDCVFHVASPVLFNDIKDPQAELVEPARSGTLNVLRSCLKVQSIKRVVITSSIGAVIVSQKGFEGNATIDETWYSDPTLCEEIQDWYSLSKTLAEEEAWTFAKQHGIDLVVINPGMVIGRCFQPVLNFTFKDFLVFLKEGKSMFIAAGLACLVDVRDVVDAHVLAFENPSANGRYCLVATLLHVSEVYDILRKLYPTLKLPECDENNLLKESSMHISQKKAESLGVNFVPVEESLKETIELLKERNMLDI